MRPYIEDGTLYLPSWEWSHPLPPVAVNGPPRGRLPAELFGVPVVVTRLYDGLGATGAAIQCGNGWGISFYCGGDDGEGLVEQVTLFSASEVDAEGWRKFRYEDIVGDFDAAFPRILRDLSERGDP